MLLLLHLSLLGLRHGCSLLRRVLLTGLLAGNLTLVWILTRLISAHLLLLLNGRLLSLRVLLASKLSLLSLVRNVSTWHSFTLRLHLGLLLEHALVSGLLHS